MPKTTEQMEKERLRRVKELNDKIQKSTHFEKVNNERRSLGEITKAEHNRLTSKQTAKEKRIARKQKSNENNGSAVAKHIEPIKFIIPGLIVVIEHLRRDIDCLLARSFIVESCETVASNEFVNDDEKVGVIGDISCSNCIEAEGHISVFLLAEFKGSKQSLILKVPNIYYPDGLTNNMVQEKIDYAISKVFNQESITVSSMNEITNKLSLGQIEAIKSNREQIAIARSNHQQSHQNQVAKMKSVEKDKKIKEWKRILSSTGAARQKDQDIEDLAKRDVAIIDGDLRGKYTMK